MQTVVALASQSNSPRDENTISMQDGVQTVVALAQSEVKILPETMDVPGEADGDTSINKEEEDIKKSNKGRDLPKVPAIDLHYDALVPYGHIDSTHVHKIMGTRSKVGMKRKL